MLDVNLSDRCYLAFKTEVNYFENEYVRATKKIN